MKIGILRVPTGVGGGIVSLTEMASILKKNGHDVWIYFDNGSSNSSIKEFNKFGSIKDRMPKEIRYLFNEESLNEDWALEKIKNTDIVIIIHRHLFSKKISESLKNVKTKIVYAPGKNKHHVFGFVDGVQSFSPSIEHISKIIFNSQNTFKLHNDAEYPDNYKRKFKYIHPPMDLDLYSENKNNIKIEKEREKLGIKNSDFAIGIIGRLIPSKKPDDVIKIALNIINKNKRYKFYLIGDGPLRSDIDKKIKKYNLGENVFITGMDSNPFKKIMSMDCILHLCEEESMSRSLREAMFFGKPIVAFNGSGNKELCNGYLKEILFDNYVQAINNILLLSGNKEIYIKYSQLSRSRIIEMEKMHLPIFLNFIADFK